MATQTYRWDEQQLARVPRRRRKWPARLFYTFLALVVAAWALGSGYLYMENGRLSAEVMELRAERAAQTQVDEDHQIALDELKGKLAVQEELLSSREGFLEEVARGGNLIASLEGVLALPELRSTITALQEEVLAERHDPAVVTSAAARLSELIASTEAKHRSFLPAPIEEEAPDGE